MSIKSQENNMKAIHALVSQDLGYIYGERESGPNGAKKEFLSKSAAFLRTLGNDLGFQEMKVTTNKGGIAVSGDVSLYGMWGDGNGLSFYINQPLQPFDGFLYRHITSMKDTRGGNNQWLPCRLFKENDYEALINMLMVLKKPVEVDKIVKRAA